MPNLKKKTKSISLSLLFLLTLFFLPFLSAEVQLNQTTIKSEGLNLTLNIIGNIFFGELSITNNSIYFDYVKLNSADTEYFSNINFTSRNQNITGFPIWFSSSSSTSKTINSNISMNITVIINSDCLTVHTITYTPNGSYLLNFPKGSYACNNNQIIFNDILVNNGINTFTLDYKDYGIAGSCNASASILTTVISYLGMIFLVIVFAIILVIVLLSLSGYIDIASLANNEELFNWKNLLIGIFIALLVISIIVVFTGLFNDAIC